MLERLRKAHTPGECDANKSWDRHTLGLDSTQTLRRPKTRHWDDDTWVFPFLAMNNGAVRKGRAPRPGSLPTETPGPPAGARLSPAAPALPPAALPSARRRPPATLTSARRPPRSSSQPERSDPQGRKTVPQRGPQTPAAARRLPRQPPLLPVSPLRLLASGGGTSGTRPGAGPRAWPWFSARPVLDKEQGTR